jgi:hypothetical protein
MPTWLKKAAPFALATLVAVGLAVVYFESEDGGSSAEGFEARIPAVEFLYLDGERVLKYLAELEGGDVGSVHRISKEIRQVDVGAEQGGIKVGASSQYETSAESTVTRTESSALGVLLAKLEDNEREYVHYHDIELNRIADLKDVREGMLVKFVTHFLLSPGYIRPYVVVRQSATLSALFPNGGGDETAVNSAAEQQRRAESFVRQIGPDPRLTFAVAPPPGEGGRRLKLLLPMRYRGLTEERSLLEKGPDEYTGGRLVVVGKVIRLFKHRAHCRADGVCGGKSEPEYTDYATRETWRNPIEGASNYLIDHVSHSCAVRRSKVELRRLRQGGEDSVRALEGRPCFLRKLARQTELHAPGAVILPIAIWK